MMVEVGPLTALLAFGILFAFAWLLGAMAARAATTSQVHRPALTRAKHKGSHCSPSEATA